MKITINVFVSDKGDLPLSPARILVRYIGMEPRGPLSLHYWAEVNADGQELFLCCCWSSAASNCTVLLV